MSSIASDSTLTDHEMGGDARSAQFSSASCVRPETVLLDNDIAIIPAEPAQRFSREARPAQPVGQHLATMRRTSRPDDLDILCRQFLQALGIPTVDSRKPLLNYTERAHGHEPTVEQPG